MEIYGEVRSLDILKGLIDIVLGHCPFRIPWKCSVHVKIKARYAPFDRIDPQGIHRRVNVYRSPEMLRMLPYPTVHKISHKLSLQLIAVDSRNK